mmetsp:Transcript_13297/g.35651  ORF Transcript_13297/g.35651 Transcript_13297/m.35651 type:complete len:227 (+) Transcript_13297:64-744(+)
MGHSGGTRVAAPPRAEPPAGKRPLLRPLLVLVPLAALSACCRLVACFVESPGFRLQSQHRGRAHTSSLQRRAAPAQPASVTIEKKMTDLDKRVQAVEKPEDELYWRVLAYCTACRTPWCKLPWRKNTCLKGDAKAEGSRGLRCDMSWEDYTDILTKSVPLISRQKAQILTRECWRQGDADPSGIGVVTIAIVPRPAAEDYCASLSQNGVQCSVVPDSFFEGGPSSQ